MNAEGRPEGRPADSQAEHIGGDEASGTAGSFVDAWRDAESLGDLLSQTPSGVSQILDDVAAFIRRYVVMTPEQATAVTLWVAHSHCVDSFEISPYLAISSAEKRSGKTTTMKLLEVLAARPWRVVTPSEAVVYRKIDRDRPTVLLDEYDTIFKDRDYEPLRALLNAGNEPGTTVPRCGGANRDQLIDFKIYAAKALAGIGRLPETIADRAIEIRLKRKRDGEEVERFRRREVRDTAEPFRQALDALGKRYADQLSEARPDLPGEIDDRAADFWEPLMAVSDLGDGEWPARARVAALALSGQREEDNESLGVRLLADCKETLNGHERISTKQLIELLCLIDESPWGEKWWDSYKGEQKKGASANLAWHLRRYGIHSKKIRFEDGPLQGYEREGFEDAWTRYLPSSPPLSRNNRNNPHEQSDCDPFESRNNTPAVPAQERPPKPHGHSDVPDVPAEKPQEGQGELDLGTASLDEIRRQHEAGLL
jgi:hypothetical protein